MAILSIDLKASFPTLLVRKSFQDAFKLLPWSVLKSLCQSISPKLRFCSRSHARSSFWLSWNVRKSFTKRRIKRTGLRHRSGGFILIVFSPETLPKTLLYSVLRTASKFCHSSLFPFASFPGGFVCPHGATSKKIIGYTSICA